MTRFLKSLDACMQDPKLTQNFSEAVQVDKKRIEENRDAYNKAKQNFYAAQADGADQYVDGTSE